MQMYIYITRVIQKNGLAYIVKKSMFLFFKLLRIHDFINRFYTIISK